MVLFVGTPAGRDRPLSLQTSPICDVQGPSQCSRCIRTPLSPTLPPIPHIRTLPPASRALQPLGVLHRPRLIPRHHPVVAGRTAQAAAVGRSGWICLHGSARKTGTSTAGVRVSCQADGSNPRGIRARSPLGNLACFHGGGSAANAPRPRSSNPGRDSTSRAETATRLRGPPRKQRHGDIHGPCPGATDKGSWGGGVAGHQNTDVLAKLVIQRQRVAFWRVHMMSLHHISFTPFRHREGEA